MSRPRKAPVRWPRGPDGMTVAEREAWRIMIGHQSEHGVALSVLDVSRRLGVRGYAAVHARVNRLVAMGRARKIACGSRVAYVAVQPDPGAAEALLTAEEMALVDRAADAWRACHGRPASLGEALAGIVEEWLEAHRREDEPCPASRSGTSTAATRRAGAGSATSGVTPTGARR